MTARQTRGAPRVWLTLTGIYGEVAGGLRLAADLRSFAQFASDALAYRARRLLNINSRTRRRTVKFKDGTELTYRLNRGDVRAIAEVWMVRTYELPFGIDARNIVDLGANIGAASVWLARRYGASKLIAVEPVPENADLARVNLARAGIDAEVITAAVAGRQGTGRFELNEDSTWGRLGPKGIAVALVTPQDVVDRFPAGERIGLVKIDVEGAEEDLFGADLSWLERVDSLVIEFHADRVDWRRIIATLAQFGFSHRKISEHDPYSGPKDETVAFQRIDRRCHSEVDAAAS